MWGHEIKRAYAQGRRLAQSPAEESLFDCAKCGRKNFTKRGLQAHHCRPAMATPINGDTNLVGKVTSLLDGDLASIRAGLKDCGMEICRAALKLEINEKHRPAVLSLLADRIRHLQRSGGAR